MVDIKRKKTLTIEEVSPLLRYEPSTGKFFWLKSTGKAVVGAEAGSIMSKGYRFISVKSRPYYAHRLSWLFSTGEWPSEDLDHINMVRDDNRFENLRLANKSQNRHNQRIPKNNTSGYKGVTWCKSCKKWQVSIKVGGKRTYLGFYTDLEQAAVVRAEATMRYHGEYGRLS